MKTCFNVVSTVQVVAAVVWTGVVTTALTAFGENYAMKSLSAAESTVLPSLPRRTPNCSPPMPTFFSVCPLLYPVPHHCR